MELTELMIGDWVKVLPISHRVESHYDRIESIRKEYTGQVYIEGGYHDRDHKGIDDWFDWSVGLNDIAPIPLTTKILEKNGFEYDPYHHTWIYDEFTINYGHLIYEEEEDYLFIWVAGTSMKLTYIHELQHALRLCGLNELANNLKL
jgi:hypothetical protein